MKKKEPISKASLKNINISPTKMRLVIDAIRGKKVDDVISFLENTRRGG